MSAGRSVADIVVAYEAGDVALAEMPSFIMEFVDEHNLEAILAELPEPHREFFLTWARDNYLSDDRVCIGGEHATLVPARALAAIRAYLR